MTHANSLIAGRGKKRRNRLPALEHPGRAGYFYSMPIYEFHCGKCERDSEILVRSSDWKGTKCPYCGSTRLDKKFSTFAAAGGGAESSACDTGGGGGHCCGGGCGCH
jgi:putative FmdB family regulatory protein